MLLKMDLHIWTSAHTVRVAAAVDKFGSCRSGNYHNESFFAVGLTSAAAWQHGVFARSRSSVTSTALSEPPLRWSQSRPDHVDGFGDSCHIRLHHTEYSDRRRRCLLSTCWLVSTSQSTNQVTVGATARRGVRGNGGRSGGVWDGWIRRR